MGLDTTHDCWHGAYSAFSRWRNAIAEAAGYKVWEVKYGDGVTRDCIMLDWGHLPAGHLWGDWPHIPADPLLILLTHQDCEGVIHAEHCSALADALEKLLPELSKLPPDGGHIGDYKTKTQAFIAGLRKAAEANETVEFH